VGLNNRKTRLSVVGAVLFFLTMTFLPNHAAVGPIAALMIAFLLGICLRPAEFQTDLIVVVSSLGGFVPLFGWFNSSDVVNPITLTAATWIFFSLNASDRRFRTSVLKFSQETRQVMIAGGASLWGYLHWRSFAQGGAETVLAKMIRVWDTSTHFWFYYSQFLRGRYLATWPKPLVGTSKGWLGTEYPAGIHYVWARAIRHPSSVEAGEAVKLFASSVIVTNAIVVGIVALAVGRLATTPSGRTAGTVMGASAGLALLIYGPMSQTMSTGFVNNSAVVGGCAIVISLMIKPIPSTNAHLVALLGSVGTVAYNWYPAGILFALACLVSAAEIVFRERPSLKKTALIVICPIVVVLPPVVQTFSLGLSHIDGRGGAVPFPQNYSIIFVVISIGFVVLGGKFGLNRSVRSLFCGPLLLLGIVGLYIRLHNGDYTYYFQKSALFSGSFSFLALIAILVKLSSLVLEKVKSRFTSRRAFVASSALATVVVSVSILQLFGYVGPDGLKYAGSAQALGMTAVETTRQVPKEEVELAGRVLKTAKKIAPMPIKEQQFIVLVLPNSTTRFSDSNAMRLMMSNRWLHSLAGGLTNSARETADQTQHFAHQGALGSDSDLANAAKNIFQPNSVFLFTTKKVTEFLSLENLGWRTQPHDH